MCNNYGNRIAYRSYVEEFARLQIPPVFPPPEAVPDLGARDEIWPTDTAPIVHAAEGGTSLLQLPWGLAPGRAVVRSSTCGPKAGTSSGAAA